MWALSGARKQGTHHVTGCSTVGGVGAVVGGGLELGFSEANGAGIVSIGASGKFRSSSSESEQPVSTSAAEGSAKE